MSTPASRTGDHPVPLPKSVNELRVAVIGAGYVGLPVATAFGAQLRTIAFDTDTKRIESLKAGNDATHEVSKDELAASSHLTFSSDPADLKQANFFIVTVPTPIDAYKRPDLSYLERASESVGAALKPGDTVVYESTVYPGATEEVCVPVLERVSGLTFNTDFAAGYSPERINPGDKKHRIADIVKVTSGSTPAAADLVDAAYSLIIKAGTHKATSIRVAEAAKVIENIQRDVNIALINELSVLFRQMDLDTEEVLAAAGTKWNFLPFRPGLVGGHCIGVDPYYLTHKAHAVGHHPEMILAGRRINDAMGGHAARLVLDAMALRGITIKDARILVLGLAFKENCPDVRNTLVATTIRELQRRGAQVDVHDPWVDPQAAEHETGVTLTETPEPGTYDAVVLAVAHSQFVDAGPATARSYLHSNGILADLKWAFPPDQTDIRL